MMELWYALVDLLPFEWAQPGSMYFMKNALLAVLVISPLFGILSTMVVHSRMSFFSDALGHSAFTGMAIGALCGFSEPTWAAVLFSLVFALLFNFVRRRTRLASDTVIGVFSSTAVALGIFISTLGSRSFTKFNAAPPTPICIGKTNNQSKTILMAEEIKLYHIASLGAPSRRITNMEIRIIISKTSDGTNQNR